jgi:hypothetical protein
MTQHACINHPNAPSATMCFQCHKPICRSCVVVMPDGEFCSTECSALNKTMKEALKAAQKTKPSKVVVAVGTLLVVVGLTVLYHFALGFVSEGEGKDKLKRFDIWDILLSAPDKIDKYKDQQKKP